MKFKKFINIPAFIISLAFGLFAVYMLNPDNKTILVYPNHENAHLLQYRDKTGACFSIHEDPVICPGNAKDIAKIPAQS